MNPYTATLITEVDHHDEDDWIPFADGWWMHLLFYVHTVWSWMYLTGSVERTLWHLVKDIYIHPYW